MKVKRKCLTYTLFASCFALCANGIFAQSSTLAVNAGALTPRSGATEPGKKRTSPEPEALNLARVGVSSAQPMPMTLVDAVTRALQANNIIEIARGDARFRETGVRGLEGIYDPVFNASPNFTHNSTTGSQSTNDFRINTNLSQFIGPGGGDYQAFFNNSRIENQFGQTQATSGSVISAGTSAIYSSSLGVNYHQPLFRNFGIDSRRHSIRIAKKQLEQSDLDFRNQAISTINEVERAYWDLVFALRDQQNRAANLNLARENLRQVEAKIEAGSSAPLDRAEVATELANREADLYIATQQVSISENALKQLLLLDAISAEWEQSLVPTDQPTVGVEPVSMDQALKDAMDNRYELKRLKLDRDINDLDVKFFKNQTKPQIDLNSTFFLSGFARNGTNAGFTTNLFTSVGELRFFDRINQLSAFHGLPALVNDTIVIPPVPSFLFGNFGQSLANLFRNDAPNYTFGLTISFPFRNRTAKANLAGALIQRDQLDARTRSEEQVVIVQVRNAVQAVETARQRVLAAQRARVNAEIQLEGERKLYDAGRSTTFLLFTRENSLTTARNAEIRAETDYRKAIADLQRFTGTTFREKNIEIASPLAKK